LAYQSAALFACQDDLVDEANVGHAKSLAAFYGYHASTRWGIFADSVGLTPFNSHWLSEDDWYLLPTIPWDDIDTEEHGLSAYSPSGVLSGAPDKAALATHAAPTRLLQSVDDELVHRLDGWRERALKESKSTNAVDAQLQTLFAKLFVLRTIEDKKLAPDVPVLSGAIGDHGTLKLDVLIECFEGARIHVGSELFSQVELTAIPEHIISGVISDLYYPARLSRSGYKYNFSWIDADILGLAYEKYLSTILSPRAPAKQLDLFAGQTLDVERISVRKSGGVYYTPQYLTRHLASACVERFLKDAGDDAIPKVIDFACGSGSFLVSAIDALLPRLKARDKNKNWARELIEGGYISGVDIDEKAVTVARLNIWNRLAEEPDPLPLPNLSKVVVQGDGLAPDSWGDLSKAYDICLGNPPFLATARVSGRDELETRFASAKGRYDFSYLFLEQAIRVTDPTGSIGMVMPNRLFRNKNAGPIRSILTARMDIQQIVDFGSNEVFAGTSAYVGCIVASHRAVMAPDVDHLDVIEVEELPERYMAQILLGEGPDTGVVRRFRATHPRGSSPWLLLSDSEKLQQVRVSEASLPLSEVSAVVQGIRTGANDIFIVNGGDEGEQFVNVTNGLGDSYLVERELLEPVVYGSEVARYATLAPTRYLIYPYKGGVCISEAELEENYPQTYRYLKAYRAILSSRTSINASGLKWYELVRRRDEAWLRAPKLLIRDLARDTSFAADEAGSLFMVGGTAVVPESEDLLRPLLGYLNSTPVSKLVKRTTPEFRGGFQKFEPQHLQRIPVLRQLIEDESFSDKIAALTTDIVSSENLGQESEADTSLDELILNAMAAAGIETDG
jgi:hypothetical protein